MDSGVKIYKPKNNIRVVTATSLFDGHDASINIIRRLLQAAGVEVIHLGHNRSAREFVGHIEFFKYMVDLLRENNVSHIKVFGGGGGVIVPDEIRELEAYGVAKIYSPEDGTKMGLQGMINHMVKMLDFPTVDNTGFTVDRLQPDNKYAVANMITAVELARAENDGRLAGIQSSLKRKIGDRKIPVMGITGTGGAGKSSLTDELILRLLHDLKDVNIAILCSDPSRRKTGGALLGDRIRMNAIMNPRVYMRSFATRQSNAEVTEALADAINVVKAAGYDLVIAETAGIGQGDSKITDMVDVSMYVMTSEFGAASQLEKIDMLDYADLIVVNKYEKRGGEDAVRDVRKQVQRNREQWEKSVEEMPVFGTIASKFNDDGVTGLYHALLDTIAENTGVKFESTLQRANVKTSSSKTIIIPPDRTRYLAEIAQTVRGYHQDTEKQASVVRRIWHLQESIAALRKDRPDDDSTRGIEPLKKELAASENHLAGETDKLLEQWDQVRNMYTRDELVYHVRDQEIRVPLYSESLSHQKIPKIALPKFTDPGENYRWMRRENLPGYFPFTGGVFPLKREDEEPTRMFAGEGDAFKTNQRFKLLSSNYEAKRLSTAFDSVTLYGYDPEVRPDIYGKIGNSGVSICTLDDVKVLYDGFDLCASNTSVSMTINGPAPIMLAMFLNTAVDQQVDKYLAESSVKLTDAKYREIRDQVLQSVRGTIQADILKEDQGQNTCIFSIEFALKMMGD
ncbi:MAG: methylmalonyl-CoA mutase, partial [Deltaproteobacteria bacterium]|nr:methylmalonyl-CoA mutase [Deltaproteobacteria bacterium]